MQDAPILLYDMILASNDQNSTFSIRIMPRNTIHEQQFTAFYNRQLPYCTSAQPRMS